VQIYILHFAETLRKYPAFPAIPRRCNEDYKIPNTDIVLKKGVDLIISISGLHYDPEYYPNPEVFDPERFSGENKNSRPAFTWIPFGEGPRACIGLRFALLQSKVGLVTLLKNYNIKLNQNTKLPLKFEKLTFITITEGRIWFDVERIDTNVSS
jgi:cytochrome P450 family 6